MSNAILTSSQYQECRRIDLIVIHCSATRTPEQKETLHRLIERLQEDYPEARVVGHRDLPGVKKDCPCFDI